VSQVVKDLQIAIEETKCAMDRLVDTIDDGLVTGEAANKAYAKIVIYESNLEELEMLLAEFI